MDVNKTIGKNEEIGYLAASALGNPPEEARTMVIPNLGYRNVDSKAYVPTGHETESGQKEHPEVGVTEAPDGSYTTADAGVPKKDHSDTAMNTVDNNNSSKGKTEAIEQKDPTGTEASENTVVERVGHEETKPNNTPEPEATTGTTTQTLEEGQPSNSSPTEQVIGNQDKPDDGRHRYAYACVVCPFEDDSPLLEEKITRAWKEYSNVNFPGRILRFVAQAYDTKARRFCGDPVHVEIIPNDISHGSVPGRTIGIAGFLVENTDTPNSDDGGLHPTDSIGWTRGRVWISMAFDLYDQIGHIVGYSNSDGDFSLPLSGMSTALGLQPIAPIGH